jgi:putative ABC transport system ATP-binding protein
MAIIRQLKEDGKTILIASHDPIVYDSELMTSRIELRDGCVIRAGSGS